MKTRIDLKVSYKIIDDRKVICYVTPTITTKNPLLEVLNIYYPTTIKLRTYKGYTVRKTDDDCNIQMAKDIAKKKAMRAAYRGIARNIETEFVKEKRKIEKINEYIAFLKNKANELTNEIIEITKEN